MYNILQDSVYFICLELLPLLELTGLVNKTYVYFLHSLSACIVQNVVNLCVCAYLYLMLCICVFWPMHGTHSYFLLVCLYSLCLPVHWLIHSFIHYCLFTVFIHFGDMSLSSIVWFVFCLFTLASSVLLHHVCVSFYSLCRWYYGNINRVKAEKLLLASQNKDGSFLVRISESHSDEYTISGKCPHNYLFIPLFSTLRLGKL